MLGTPLRVRHARQLDRAFEVTRALVESDQLPCAALAVASGDGVLRIETYSGTLKVCDDTLFPYASISKPITAVSAVQLVQDGQLSLSQTIDTYLPDFRPPGVTMWHLLTHTSGLAEDIAFGDMIRTRPSREEYLRRAYGSALAFTPGTRHAYNQLTFFLLAELMTAVSGLPYREHQRRFLFEPLSLHSLTYDTTESPGRFHWLQAWRTLPSDDIPVTNEEWTRYAAQLAGPAFGLWGTIHDLIAFAQAQLTDLTRGTRRVLSAPYVELMTRNHTAHLTELTQGVPRPVARGLGWGKGHDLLPGSPRVFKHGGGDGGLLWVDPDYDLAYAFLSYREDSLKQFLPLQAVYGALSA